MYTLIKEQAACMIANCPYPLANLSNITALLYQNLDRLNWAGFYRMEDGHLVLGPFQGKIACTEIAVGKGVCGTAVLEDSIQLVKDVHQFPGHIACDCASNSEIVIPLHKDGKIWGVLDIDSPETGRFSETDREGLKQLTDLMEANAGRVLL